MTEILDTPYRILDMLKAAKISQAKIAETLGLPQSAVSNLFHGKRQLKLTEAHALIAMLPNVVPSRAMPVVPIEAARQWQKIVSVPGEELWVDRKLAGSSRFAMCCTDDRLQPAFPQGSFALVDPDDKRMFSGRLYVLQAQDGAGDIMQFRDDPARFESVAEVGRSPTFELGAESFTILGRVTAAIRTF
jgi:repressor LexA